MRAMRLIVAVSLLVISTADARADDPDSGNRKEAIGTGRTAGAPKPLPGTRDYEWFKFASPPDWIVDHDSGYPPGPEGTPWEDHYRSLVQADERAVSKGLPSHEQAIEAIDASAAASNGQTQQHKIYVLYAKQKTEAHRPDSATSALREIFGRLVEREFTSQWNNTTSVPVLPFRDDPGLTIHRDVVYGSVDPAQQRLDTYLVRSDKPTPVLMEFHGGGWRRGSRKMLHQYKGGLIREILDAGISVVAVDYRLAPGHRFPAQMEDAARAVQFVRSKADEWNIDPDRISAIGGSAGGHLLSWVALNDDQADPADNDPVARQSSRLNCFIVQWAPVDLTRVNPLELQRSGPRGPDSANAICSVLALHPEDFDKPENQTRIRAASPVFQVTTDDPPAFLMYGGTPEGLDVSNPPPVPNTIHNPHSYWHGLILAEALERAGVPYVPHFGTSVGKDPATDNEAVVGFLKRCFRMAQPFSGQADSE